MSSVVHRAAFSLHASGIDLVASSHAEVVGDDYVCPRQRAGVQGRRHGSRPERSYRAGGALLYIDATGILAEGRVVGGAVDSIAGKVSATTARGAGEVTRAESFEPEARVQWNEALGAD